MPQNRKGSGTPAKPGMVSPIKHTLAFQPVQARTVVGISDETLPPLVEGISNGKAVEKKGIFPFDIEVNQEYTLHVTRKIGEGGMGEVFRAVEVLTSPGGKKGRGKEVAVKLVHVSEDVLGSDPKKREANRQIIFDRFFDEVVIAMQIDNKYVIQIFLFGTTPHPRTSESVPFFSMELLKGKDMNEMLAERKRFQWAELKPLMLQVCSALTAAHGHKDHDGEQKPIIHLDIKPLNIFVTGDEKGEPFVKVLDFGLAQVLTSVKKEREVRSFCGTPDYMSPEQAMEEKEDHRTDIYALGITMYQLLSGHTPFTWVAPENNAEYFMAWNRYCSVIINDAAPSLIDSGIDIPADVEQMIFRCLAKDPANRFQSVLELQKAIKNCDRADETAAKEQATAVETPAAEPFPEPGAEELNGHPYREVVPSAQASVAQESVEQEPISSPVRKRLRYGLLASAVLTTFAGGVFAVNRFMENDPENRPTITRAADASIRAPLPDLMPAAVPDTSMPPDLQAAAQGDMEVRKLTPEAGIRKAKRRPRYRRRRKRAVKKNKFMIPDE
jgi:serine/threonine-protein kinase